MALEINAGPIPFSEESTDGIGALSVFAADSNTQTSEHRRVQELLR